jgi:hypothetical protein
MWALMPMLRYRSIGVLRGTFCSLALDCQRLAASHVSHPWFVICDR